MLFLWQQMRASVLHPPAAPVVVLLLGLVVSTLVLLAAGAKRLARGPGRARAAAWVLVGLVPLAMIGLPTEIVRRRWEDRDATVTPVTRLVAFGGAAVMEAAARVQYPHRVETPRLLMFHRGVARPQEDAERMERHVAAIEARIGRPMRDKIYWVRGSVLGQGGLANNGLTLGSDHSDPPEEIEGMALVLDRHELAHGVIHQYMPPDAAPPSFLVEGWAECYSYGLPRQAVTDHRADARETRGAGVWVPLRELSGPTWYYRHAGPAYSHGHVWVEFLVRRFGMEKFIELYNTCRPATFDADCRRVLGAGVDELEPMLWQDIAAGDAPPGPPETKPAGVEIRYR